MKKRIFIEGMKCGNCANHVKEALNSIEGITNIDVHLSDKYAVIEANISISDEIIESAVNSERYNVIKVEII